MRLQDYITENSEEKKRFEKYLKTNSMLKAGMEVIRKIRKDGGDAWVVGGAVRDIVMGDNPHDIDIATNHPMEKLDKLFKTYDIGQSKDFGIVVVNHKGHQFEIAQLRADGQYSDGRKPETVSFNVDLRGDMARRDLQINAMAIDSEGNIIDHFNGMKAIKDKIIQTVGNPNDRFEEDRLRILRTARFAGKLGFKIDTKTKDAMMSQADKLTDLSSERIKDELWKMASQSGDKFANTIRILDDTGILKIVLPEIMKMKDFPENIKHHPEAYADGGKGTPFDHMMKALRKNKLADPLVNMGILLHDIGKGYTFKEKDGKPTFYGHASDAEEIINNIAKRLKISNKEKDAIMFAVLNHMKLHNGLEMKPSKIIKLVKDKNWELLKVVSYCDTSCRGKLFDKKRFDDTVDGMQKIAKKWGDKTVGTVVKIVDGNRVMKLTGMRPSKQVGDLIKKVTDVVISKGIKSDRDIDKLIVKLYKEMK